MIPSITETWTVISESGDEIWSSGPNEETSAAADRAARDSNGTVLRALYRLVSVDQETSYASLPFVLAKRNQIREAVTEWEEAALGASDDAKHTAARNMADVLESLLEG